MVRLLINVGNPLRVVGLHGYTLIKKSHPNEGMALGYWE
jgi:hypothetical protein